MFKCRECQTEYEIKPDYCDCGNDTFDEIVEKKQIEPEKKVTNTTSKSIEIKDANLNKSEHLEKFIQKTETKQQTTKKEPKITIQAWITFGILLILSLIVLLLPVKQNEQSIAPQKKQEYQTNNEIPNIEKIWNNTPIKISEPKIVKTEILQQEINVSKSRKETSTNISPKKKLQEDTKKQVQTTPQTTKSTSQAIKTTTPQQIQQTTQTINKQDIARYNIRLRNYIASKIDFAGIVGDGSCSFTFKVDSNGNLLNKKAGTLSDNESLNEKVYNALRQTTIFDAPPKGYNTNAILKLYVKMINGAFEVSLY